MSSSTYQNVAACHKSLSDVEYTVHYTSKDMIITNKVLLTFSIPFSAGLKG